MVPMTPYDPADVPSQPQVDHDFLLAPPELAQRRKPTTFFGSNDLVVLDWFPTF